MNVVSQIGWFKVPGSAFNMTPEFINATGFPKIAVIILLPDEICGRDSINFK